MTTILLAPSKARRKQFASLHAQAVSSKAEMRASLPKADKNTVWISGDQKSLVELLRSLRSPARRLGRVVMLFKPDLELLPALWTWFDAVAFGSHGGFLPGEEFAAALAADNRDDLFVGGLVDPASETLTLWRGNLASLVVPFSAFPASGDGIKPDFDKFSVADYGHTIRLGEYEAASDAILYEYDADYRRRKAKERIASDKGLGASIRRLRKQRGLTREDFAPLSSKTIARIEQGKVNSIHGKTQATIAKVLRVNPEELESY
jgi:DNA-binding XRE family transcriptional regulator